MKDVWKTPVWISCSERVTKSVTKQQVSLKQVSNLKYSWKTLTSFTSQKQQPKITTLNVLIKAFITTF